MGPISSLSALASESATISTTSNGGIFITILSAAAGGFFAAYFNNIYESKRRFEDKRTDKYFEHRNTIVQIEHELIPVRVNMSRNLKSLDEALKNNHSNNTRLILRFYKLDFSTGLTLKLLNIDLINLYSEVYVLLQSINSDFQYVDGIVNAVRDELVKYRRPDESKLQMYSTIISHLKEQCEETDNKTLKLLSFCQAIIAMGDNEVKDLYVEQGGQIKYEIPEKILTAKAKETQRQENLKYKEGEKQPKFFTPYLDVMKVPSTRPGANA